MTGNRTFPEAQRHGDLDEIFPGIYFVTGSVAMKGPPPMRFSRNMTVVAQDGELVLINSVRLDAAGLAALDALGNVKHVIRLAGFHGMDDPFYKDRYGATVWSVDGSYFAGFDGKGETYLTPDVRMDETTGLPLKNARLIDIKSAKTGEALLLIDREGGILVAGDCLQNWAKTNRYFNLPARLMMKMMGFIKPHNVGPGWLKGANPDRQELRETILALEFDHLLPAHGDPVIGGAKQHYRPALEAL
ncbi:MAG: hypothetical protein GY789_07980 [Hyphomicrobiales bacterium]|nr:hypothetical protein [Hyphomicrobiales bacterium]MCP4998029.1 hypothetical protein [Hyphomicrobiales bacterium]